MSAPPQGSGRADLRGLVIFTSSQNWTVPAGVHRIKFLAIGGGGGGGGGYSSTYVGGAGGSSQSVYAEVEVQPGTEFMINVGAGGSGGTGGSSPASGGLGGDTYITYPTSSNLFLKSPGGGAGGAASSSANGNAGSPQGIENMMSGTEGNTSAVVVAGYAGPGQAGNGQTPGLVQVLLPTFSGTSNNYYGYPNAETNLSYGAGGLGGGVNENGQPGIQGIVVIWWGD